ncbi:unnamed protein product [Sphagnum compactum]
MRDVFSVEDLIRRPEYPPLEPRRAPLVVPQISKHVSEEEKPSLSYAELIKEALEMNSHRLMTLADIYESIMSRYSYYRMAQPGWKNSIRHNLSLHKTFARVARSEDNPGKGSYWKLSTGDPCEIPKKARQSRRALFQYKPPAPSEPLPSIQMNAEEERNMKNENMDLYPQSPICAHNAQGLSPVTRAPIHYSIAGSTFYSPVTSPVLLSQYLYYYSGIDTVPMSAAGRTSDTGYLGPLGQPDSEPFYRAWSPSKGLLEKFGVRVQPFVVGSSCEELYRLAKKALPLGSLVVKAQVLAGGRGKGVFLNSGLKSGIHVENTLDDALDKARKMLNDRLVTPQTVQSGIPVHKVMLASAVDIVREGYFSVTVDREMATLVVCASRFGGMDIESVGRENLFREWIDIRNGLSDVQLGRIADEIGFGDSSIRKETMRQLACMYRLFVSMDALQVEVNPIAMTDDGHVVAVDAKMTIDDNALFRSGLGFDVGGQVEEEGIGLDGNIGCLVNGAGLAMATMDLVALYGGRVANFLDIGGGASEEGVEKAILSIAMNPKVSAMFVNVFGGIVRCDTVARGVCRGIAGSGRKIPLVLRLSGTRIEEAHAVLRQYDLPFVIVEDMDQGAQLVCRMSQ